MKKMIALSCCFAMFSACENVDNRKYSPPQDPNRMEYNGNQTPPNSQQMPNYQNGPSHQNPPNGSYNSMQEANRSMRDASRSVQDASRSVQNAMRNNNSQNL